MSGCLDLLGGGHADPGLILVLGGGPARWAATGEAPGPDYWLRVWAARGLLWAWEERAASAVLSALHDEAWRVREAALRVVAHHRLEDAVVIATELGEQDPVPRVRTAADRALRRVGALPGPGGEA